MEPQLIWGSTRRVKKVGSIERSLQPQFNHLLCPAAYNQIMPAKDCVVMMLPNAVSLSDSCPLHGASAPVIR